MTGRRRLRAIPGGCTFVWADSEAEAEAAALVARFPTIDVAHLDVLIDLLEQGRLREKVGRKAGDYRSIARHPMFELRIETTVPRLRLYFVERPGPRGLFAVGLLLATKPGGGRSAQTQQQDRDIDEAWARLSRWNYPR